MGILWALALPVQAYTEVTNTVVTEANTGGGGTATAHTKVYTEVNGEVVTDIDEEKTSTDGSPVVVETNVTYSDNWRDMPTDVDMVSKSQTQEEIIQENTMMNDEEFEAMEEVMDEMMDDHMEDFEVRAEANATVFSRIKIFFKTYVFWWL